MCSTNLRNGTIFMFSGKVYSTFKRAEEELLAWIRSLKYTGFAASIKCIQVDTNHTRQTDYHGSIDLKDGFKHIIIKRDEKNKNDCKKTHREKIRISLDY